MHMHQYLRDTLGLGAGFWLIGYLLSLILYFLVPLNLVGWILFAGLTPVMIGVTCWWFRDRTLPLASYLLIAITWTLIAMIGDYLFIVLLFSSPGYYTADVIVYYAETFLIPLGVGIARSMKQVKDPGTL